MLVRILIATSSIWLLQAADAQPSIPTGGIPNAGSYATPGQAHYGIAQGSVFVVFGTNLGAATPTQASRYPLPGADGLNGTSISVTISGISRSALMLYASHLVFSEPAQDAAVNSPSLGAAEIRNASDYDQRNSEYNVPGSIEPRVIGDGLLYMCRTRRGQPVHRAVVCLTACRRG